MTNGNHGRGAAIAGRSRAPQSSESHLEEILHQITPEEEAQFKEHLTYRTPQASRTLRYDKFGNIEQGTEKLFNDIYHNAYQTATAKGLKAKKDDAAIADTLELVVVEALRKLASAGTHLSQSADHAWKNFELMKKEGTFRGDTERLVHLQNLASEYLGASDQNISALIQLLRSGDPGVWGETVRNFTNQLKDSLVDQYVSQHLMKSLTNENRHKWQAYAIKHLREALGKEPENLPRYMSPTMTPLPQIMQRVGQLYMRSDKGAETVMRLKDYKPPRKQAAGHN